MTKQPVVRKGQRKPYSKATRRELEQRLRAAAWLDLYIDCEPSLIYDFFHEVFGVDCHVIRHQETRTPHIEYELKKHAL